LLPDRPPLTHRTTLHYTSSPPPPLVVLLLLLLYTPHFPPFPPAAHPPNRHTRSATARETKQILADINAGSQKVRRKLLSPGHKRGNSQSTITPVTVLNPEPDDDDERKGRKSTSSNRPKLLKRSSSMKRAYNYFFGGPSPAPPSPSTPTDPSKPADAEASRAAPDTPPKTPAAEAFAPEAATASEVALPSEDEPAHVQLEKLKAKLAKAQEQLDEANEVVARQNDAMDNLEKESETLRSEFSEKESALLQEKKTLEDHMVSVVVQQVKEAKESERHAVMEAVEKEYVAKLVRKNFNQAATSTGNQQSWSKVRQQHTTAPERQCYFII
jgi:hypothetical protein